MIGALRTLALRREVLVARSEAQRAALARAAAPFSSKLAAADRLGRSIRSHPIVAALGVGAIALLGGRRLLGWAARGLAVLSLVRRAL